MSLASQGYGCNSTIYLDRSKIHDNDHCQRIRLSFAEYIIIVLQVRAAAGAQCILCYNVFYFLHLTVLSAKEATTGFSLSS